MKTNLKTAFVILLAITTVAGLGFRPSAANALSGSDFNPGRIAEDTVFYNGNAMSTPDIQTFLNAKVPTCDTNGTTIYSGSQTRAQYGASKGYSAPYTCLKDYSESVPAKTADAYCSPVSPGMKSAAQIIYDVAQACSVSPKVILVLLQKEQSLVTDTWPWSIQYRSATGYGCPDTASCDPQYYGFFNQVYYGARQYQRYAKQANLFNYQAGKTSYIQYNPTASCGGTNIYLQTQATAGLYNYTPYQPNQAALNNLYGTGDGCSAYGNRNFWRMYIDWFGSLTSNNAYEWMFEGQQAYSDAAMSSAFTEVPTVTPGGKVYVRVKARNMGTQTWFNSTTKIAPSSPIDHPSIFADASWMSPVRTVVLKEPRIDPGQIGTFEFTLSAPNTTGSYRQYFNLLVEGTTWLNDPGLYFAVNVAVPTTPTNSGNAGLQPGQSLDKDGVLLSPDAQSTLVLQQDGNLILNADFNPVWYTGAYGSRAKTLIMQTDGNLVLYDINGAPLWNTQTSGNPNAHLVIQSDGNLVLYSSGGTPLWATYTVHTPDHLEYVNTFINSDQIMYPGQTIDTADRRFHLVLQTDGNLVLYSPTKAIWASGTNGKKVKNLIMQTDGNLVLYDTSARPVWNTGTNGSGRLQLVVQQDGNLVLYDPAYRAHWDSHTMGAQ